ncbi:MAG: MFS transporter, partial [Aeromonadaceae bacterium]
TVGSLCAALATDLTQLLIARFVAGMGHGLFLAVASSTAARLAGADKAGQAVALVFSGFTLAMAIGVPICTWLGHLISWRLVLGVIAIFGAIGTIGLALGMRDPLATAQPATSRSVKAMLSPLVDRRLLMATLVTVLAYAGSFTAYTFIAPLLTDITQVSSDTIGLFMLMYGVMAAIGNLLGGRLTDSIGIQRANTVLISGIILTVLAMWVLAHSPLAMGILVALLGLFTFAVVPSLQARLLGIARAHNPDADSIAAGLNIAGFNSGIVFGSLLSTLTVSQLNLSTTGLIGAIVSLAGLCLMFWQTPRHGDTVLALENDH